VSAHVSLLVLIKLDPEIFTRTLAPAYAPIGKYPLIIGVRITFNSNEFEYSCLLYVTETEETKEVKLLLLVASTENNGLKQDNAVSFMKEAFEKIRCALTL